MNRRKFLKASLCAGCIAALGGGCFFSNSKDKDLALKPESKFLFKSVDELPTKVRLEACNDCQLNCVSCWMRTVDPEVINKVGGFGYLKFEDFKNFVDRNSFVKKIELSNNGEIFLNPELDDIIKYAYEKGIKLTAENGVNLNTVSDETLENLVKYKFDVITVSIDGATPEVYQMYRRGGDFNTVIGNIEKINKFKEQYDSTKPELNYQFIVFGHNEHEIDAARELAEELNMNIVYIKNLATEFSAIKDIKTVEEKTGLKYPEYYDPDNVEINPEDIICYQLFQSPQINFNGDLFGCCGLFDENFGVNVFKEGLFDALNNDKVLRAKNMLTDLSVEPMDDIPCTRCGLYCEVLQEKNYPVVFPQAETV